MIKQNCKKIEAGVQPLSIKIISYFSNGLAATSLAGIGKKFT